MNYIHKCWEKRNNNKKTAFGVIFICKDFKQQTVILISEQAFVFLKE